MPAAVHVVAPALIARHLYRGQGDVVDLPRRRDLQQRHGDHEATPWGRALSNLPVATEARATSASPDPTARAHVPEKDRTQLRPGGQHRWPGGRGHLARSVGNDRVSLGQLTRRLGRLGDRLAQAEAELERGLVGTWA